ncbi:ankyrin repeat-containing domain protein [Nemania sp. FL0916]|nr:ankyrin repeat-containing domain protein [Nemania sp. FL0916]
MDPLSITASILAILGAVRASVKVAQSIYDAPEQIDSIMNDLTDAEILVRTVETTLTHHANVQAKDGFSKDQRDDISQKLSTVKEVLSELERLIHLQGKRDGKYRRVAWTLAKSKTLKLRQKLQGLCEGLRQQLGNLRASFVELELQHVSVILSETVDIQERIHRQGESISNDMDALLRLQEEEGTSRRQSESEIIKLAAETHAQSTQLLERFRNIEDYLMTDRLSTPLGRPPEYGVETTETVVRDEKAAAEISLPMIKRTTTAKYHRVAVHAHHRQPFQCDPGCPCRCHTKPSGYSTENLRNFLGQLFVGYQGQPTTTSSCSHARCGRVRASVSATTYFFPYWWVAQRMLSMVAKLTALGGVEVTLSFPRAVPPAARIFRHAYLGDTDTIRDLFSMGLASPWDIDAKTGTTVLHYAVSSCNEKTIQYLLHKGANRNTKDATGRSAIEEAWTMLLTNGVSDSQRRVLEPICDEETLDDFELPELHRSVVRISKQSVEISIKSLIRTSATIEDTDAFGKTALLWAAESGDADAVRLLLENGANPNSIAKGQRSALHYAAQTNASADCTTLLLNADADTSVGDLAGLTPLMWACINRKGDFANLHALVGHSDLELTDINERTALFHAASSGVVPTSILIRAGCNVNHADDKGITALCLAISYNRSGVIQMLLSAGADYQARVSPSDDNILHLVAQYGSIETIEELRTCDLAGLNVNHSNAEGCTPLDHLETRVPEASPELFEAFSQLCVYVEAQTAMIADLADNNACPSVSESEASTGDWETASEGASEQSGTFRDPVSEIVGLATIG